MKRFISSIPATTLAATFIAGSVLLSPTGASATLVTGWGAETGFSAGTVTEGSAGSFTSTPTGNLGERSTLINPYDLSVVGESVVLSGSVSLTAGTFGNQQLRFGLFNNNGNSVGTLSGGAWGGGAVASGWLGYIVEVGNANGSGNTALYGRNGSGANAWLSTSGAAYGVNTTQTDTGSYSTAPGTFAFNLTLTRLSATSVGIGYSFLETDGVGTFSAIGNYTDTGGLSSGIGSINQVGFYTPGAGLAASFTGVDVTVVPEPSTFALAGVGMVGLAAAWRRKTSQNK